MTVRVRAKGDRLQKKLAALSERGYDSAKEAVADQLDELVDRTFATKRDPSGRQWARRKTGSGSHPLLDKTGTLRRSIDVDVKADSIVVTSDAPYAQAVNAKRALVPKRGLPGKWEDKFDSASVEALEKLDR